MKTYVDFFSAESLYELTEQINADAREKELEVVNTSLSVDIKGWYFALVVFRRKEE